MGRFRIPETSASLTPWMGTDRRGRNGTGSAAMIGSGESFASAREPVPSAVENDDQEDDQGNEDSAQYVAGSTRLRRVRHLRGDEEHDDDRGSDPRQS